MTDTAPPGGAPWTQAPPASAIQPIGKVGTPTSPGTQILLTIVTFGIWAAVWTYRQHRDIQEYSGEGVGGGLGLVIYLFVGIVTPFLLANEIETKLYGKAGQQSPVTAATGAWVLLPFVGAFVWYFRVQGALNDFWMQRGANL